MSSGLGVVRNIAVRGNCGFQLEHCIDRILMQDLSCSRGKVLQNSCYHFLRLTITLPHQLCQSLVLDCVHSTRT